MNYVVAVTLFYYRDTTYCTSGLDSLARGEHGGRLGADGPSRGPAFFRRRLPGGLAGEQNEEEVSGLEEETAAGETDRDPEEAGLGLRGNRK